MHRGNPRRGIPRRETLAKSDESTTIIALYYFCTNPSCTQQNKTRARRLMKTQSMDAILRRGITQGKNKIVIIHSLVHHLNTHARALRKEKCVSRI